MIALVAATLLLAGVVAVALVREDRPYDRELQLAALHQLAQAAAVAAEVMQERMQPALARLALAFHQEAELVARRQRSWS